MQRSCYSSTGSATAQPLLWEHSPASDNGLSYNEYLTANGIAAARWYSQCKDKNCSYWVAVGEQRYRVGKDSSLIAQSRYQQITYALYRNGEQYYLADSHGQRLSGIDEGLASCVSRSDGVISRRGGELICLSGRTLWVGNRSPDAAGQAAALPVCHLVPWPLGPGHAG